VGYPAAQELLLAPQQQQERIWAAQQLQNQAVPAPPAHPLAPGGLQVPPAPVAGLDGH
jgi:hypothetical protein